MNGTTIPGWRVGLACNFWQLKGPERPAHPKPAREIDYGYNKNNLLSEYTPSKKGKPHFNTKGKEKRCVNFKEKTAPYPSALSLSLSLSARLEPSSQHPNGRHPHSHQNPPRIHLARRPRHRRCSSLTRSRRHRARAREPHATGRNDGIGPAARRAALATALAGYRGCGRAGGGARGATGGRGGGRRGG